MHLDWKRHLITFVVVFLLVGLFMGPRSCAATRSAQSLRPPDARVVAVSVEDVPLSAGQSQASFTIMAEVADTEAARQRGLTGRPGLGPGCGMLYVYPEPARPDFSWAAMRFPLSVAFLREDGTIADLVDGGPGGAASHRPAEPVRYVLEVRRGWFGDRGVGVGSRLLVPALPAASLQTPTPSQAAEG